MKWHGFLIFVLFFGFKGYAGNDVGGAGGANAQTVNFLNYSSGEIVTFVKKDSVSELDTSLNTALNESNRTVVVSSKEFIEITASLDSHSLYTLEDFGIEGEWFQEPLNSDF